MKILMVNKFLYPNGGSETYIFELGKELVRQGHEVQYFGMEHDGRTVSNHAGQYTEDMEFHGSGISKLSYPFKIIYSKEAKRKMRIVMEDFKPDVVHLNNINFQLTPSVIDAVREYDAKYHVHTRLIATAHDMQWVCPDHLMLTADRNGRYHTCFECRGGHYGNCIKNRCIHGSRLQSVLGAYEALFYAKRGTYRKIDRIISPSGFLKKQLETNPQLSGRIEVMHNFIPPVAEEYGGDADEPELPDRYVLYFGRFSEEKGIGTLLKVCRELPDIQFVFAGNGPMQGEVEKLKNVINVGFLKGKTMSDAISHAEFTVFPSECNENCSFSVMESQVYRTPIIASDLGGTPELLEDRVRGELFCGGNGDQLREKIRRWWDDPQTVAEYRAACESLPFDSVGSYCMKYLQLINNSAV